MESASHPSPENGGDTNRDGAKNKHRPTVELYRPGRYRNDAVNGLEYEKSARETNSPTKLAENVRTVKEEERRAFRQAKARKERCSQESLLKRGTFPNDVYESQSERNKRHLCNIGTSAWSSPREKLDQSDSWSVADDGSSSTRSPRHHGGRRRRHNRSNRNDANQHWETMSSISSSASKHIDEGHISLDDNRKTGRIPTGDIFGEKHEPNYSLTDSKQLSDSKNFGSDKWQRNPRLRRGQRGQHVAGRSGWDACGGDSRRGGDSKIGGNKDNKDNSGNKKYDNFDGMKRSSPSLDMEARELSLPGGSERGKDHNWRGPQRNWSFRSNHSDRLDIRNIGRKVDKRRDIITAEGCCRDNEFAVDEKVHVQSTKTKALVQEHVSLQDLCASFDQSDMASFDWGSEVEAAKKEEKERKAREEMERRLSKGSKISVENRERPLPNRSILHSPPSTSKDDNLPQKESQKWSHERENTRKTTRSARRGGQKYSDRTHRHRNDSFRSQSSSLVEPIEENIDDELNSGETTPKYEEIYQEERRLEDEKRRGSYLDEDIGYPRGRGRGRGGFGYSHRGHHSVSQLQSPKKDERKKFAPVIDKMQRKTIGVPSCGSSLLSVNTSVPPPNLSVAPPVIASRSPQLITYIPSDSRASLASDPLSEESPIHQEISRKEGPEIKSCNDDLYLLLERISESADVSAGEEIIHVCEKLSQIYSSIMCRDIRYTYAKNIEQHLWKQCFYRQIEVLRTASNCAGDVSRAFLGSLTRLIELGIVFYKQLMNKYEVVFGFIIDEYLYWPKGLPTDDFATCATIGMAFETSDKILKIALSSTQRLAVAMGDLHRYAAMVSGKKDYAQARLWYLKSAQLAPASGRSYNQLALLAVYASKMVDVIFFYVRALASRNAFETSKQPLYSTFNEIRKKMPEYESDLDERLGGRASRTDAEIAASRAERPHEIWIALDGRCTEREEGADADQRTVHNFDSESIIKLYHRTIHYLLHSAGLLITKIGMEDFDSISDRALCQTAALISRSECPLKAMQIVQITSLFLFAVNNAANSSSVEQGTCLLQQQRAVQMVLSLFGVLLKPIEESIDMLGDILTGKMPLSPKIARVLPAVFVLSEWLSTPSMNKLYRSMPSLEPLETSLVHIDVWSVLANVANALFDAQTGQKLARTVSSNSGDGGIDLVLPESVFLSSFLGVFPAVPKTQRIIIPPCSEVIASSKMLALHARLSSVLSAAEYLDGSELPCFGFSEKQRQFAATETATTPTGSIQESNTTQPSSLLSTMEPPSDRASDTSFEGEMTEEQRLYRQTVRDNQLKHELLEREVNEKRTVIEVHPDYIVPDTNTFIHHLDAFQKIAESEKFKIAVPVIVLSELRKLSLLIPMKSGIELFDDESPEDWVGKRAKVAIAYLEKVKDKRIFCTVTSQGNRISPLFSAPEELSSGDEMKKNDESIQSNNDDLVLLSCCKLSARLPTPLSRISDDHIHPRIYRSVVLLTDDRALNIKAVLKNIPCRTVTSFVKWAFS